jgi:hypothetical protein
VCDQPTAATATPLTYTGSGLSYAGVPLVATSAGAPLVLANSTAANLGPTSDNFVLVSTGPSLATNAPLTIKTSFPSSGYVSVDNSTSPAYIGSGSGTSVPELFTALDPANASNSARILPGQLALLKSSQTNAFCRLAPAPGSISATQLRVLCDQLTQATATPFLYTGTGLSVSGMQLVGTAPGAPLVLANTTGNIAALPSTSDDLTIMSGRRSAVPVLGCIRLTISAKAVGLGQRVHPQ